MSEAFLRFSRQDKALTVLCLGLGWPRALCVFEKMCPGFSQQFLQHSELIAAGQIEDPCCGAFGGLSYW